MADNSYWRAQLTAVLYFRIVINSFCVCMCNISSFLVQMTVTVDPSVVISCEFISGITRSLFEDAFNIIKSLWPGNVIATDLGHRWFSQWLVPWWHQAIIWTNIDLSSEAFCGIHLGTIPRKRVINLIRHMYFKNYCHISRDQWFNNKRRLAGPVRASDLHLNI